jgi:hypothetical protein
MSTPFLEPPQGKTHQCIHTAHMIMATVKFITAPSARTARATRRVLAATHPPRPGAFFQGAASVESTCRVTTVSQRFIDMNSCHGNGRVRATAWTRETVVVCDWWWRLVVVGVVAVVVVITMKR